MMQRIRWFLLILGIIVLLTVALANQRLVEVKLPLLFTGEVSVSTLLLTSATGGFLFGALMTAWMLRGGQRKGSSNAKSPASSSKSSSNAQGQVLVENSSEST